jgi:hypothetical protein
MRSTVYMLRHECGVMHASEQQCIVLCDRCCWTRCQCCTCYANARTAKHTCANRMPALCNSRRSSKQRGSVSSDVTGGGDSSGSDAEQQEEEEESFFVTDWTRGAAENTSEYACRLYFSNLKASASHEENCELLLRQVPRCIHTFCNSSNRSTGSAAVDGTAQRFLH